ncbi:MAG: hypothetical protein AAFU54_12560 [Chloroflexota bacterium]
MPDVPDNKPEQPENPGSDDNTENSFETDILSRLRDIPRSKSPFQARQEDPDPEPDEEFWAIFSMITHTGERFVINACFRNTQHYNAEMHKFETAKNVHVVLKDVNGESIVIKRDMLLHVLPSGQQEVPDKKSW